MSALLQLTLSRSRPFACAGTRSPLAQWAFKFRNASSKSSGDSSSSSSSSIIPVPSGDYPFIGHLPRILQDKDLAETWQRMHEECGQILRAKFPGGKSFVVTSNPAHAKEVLSNQGKYPYRLEQKAWSAVFEEKQWPESIPQAEGEDWKRRRRVLAESLLSAKTAKEYVPVVVPIANRFVDCLAGHLDQNSKRLKNATLREIAGVYALEAVMKVILGVDFPGCTVPIDAKATAFTNSVEAMFKSSGECLNMPWYVTFKFGPYQRLKSAWEEMYSYPQEAMGPILEYYEKHGKLPESTHGTVLPFLIQQHEAGELSLLEVLGIGVQGVSAAVDTTGQTTEYFLYNLARNPDVQEQIYNDVVAVSGSGSDGPMQISRESYDQQHYLFAALKESMRLTPTIGAHVRTLVQDAQLDNNLQVAQDEIVMINYLEMTTNPELFPEPDLFLPERFLKGREQKDGLEKEDTVSVSTMEMEGGCPMTAQLERKAAAKSSGSAVCKNPYAAIPFGHGGRKCLGKGFAEMDIHLAIMALLRKYRIRYDGPDLVQEERTVMRPKTPIFPHLVFEERV